MSIRECCPRTALDPADRGAQAALFKALGDPHRLTILATLARADDAVCVCDLGAGLPLNQPTVSHHLRVLREAGLVTTERRGTWIHYRLAPDAAARLDDALRTVLPLKVPA